MHFRLSRDGWLLMASCAVRSFAYGFLSVMLGLYLDAVGLGPTLIGWIFTAAIAGGAVMTLAITSVADALGRRMLLIIGALLMACAGCVFATASAPVLLAAAAVFGTISPSGKEVGPFLALEQAILSQTTADENRTAVFSAYNLVGSLSGAIGALAVGLPELLALPTLAGYRLMVWGYVAAALLLAFLFSSLSRSVERESRPDSGRQIGVRTSRGIVTKLALLFSLDAFAGGFIVQSIVAYWFYLRFATDLTALGGIFFGTNILAAASFLAAPAVARRLGLLNAMVFTHLLSNILLLLIPSMPGLQPAVLMLLARNALSQLDVPTRQSYTMAIVAADERAASAGILSVARNAGAAAAPLFTGALLAIPATGLPFLLAGSIKIVYDVAIFGLFRNVRPPEERE